MKANDDKKRVRVENSGPIVCITIDRPEKMNAMTRRMYAEIDEALEYLEGTPEARVGIITGAGDRAFSAGADLLTFHSPEEALEPWTRWRPDRWDFGLSIGKPLIAAVNGYALAGGLELALLCDIRVASTNAQFGAPEVKWGLLGAMDTYWLPKAIGPSNAMSLLLTGDFIDAEEALRMGLVSQVVSPDDLMTTALSIAKRISSNPSEAVQMTKDMVHHGLHASLEEHLRLSKSYYSLAAKSGGQEEGRVAFSHRERRERP